MLVSPFPLNLREVNMFVRSHSPRAVTPAQKTHALVPSSVTLPALPGGRETAELSLVTAVLFFHRRRRYSEAIYVLVTCLSFDIRILVLNFKFYYLLAIKT